MDIVHFTVQKLNIGDILRGQRLRTAAVLPHAEQILPVGGHGIEPAAESVQFPAGAVDQLLRIFAVSVHPPDAVGKCAIGQIENIVFRDKNLIRINLSQRLPIGAVGAHTADRPLVVADTPVIIVQTVADPLKTAAVLQKHLPFLKLPGVSDQSLRVIIGFKNKNRILRDTQSEKETPLTGGTEQHRPIAAVRIHAEQLAAGDAVELAVRHIHPCEAVPVEQRLLIAAVRSAAGKGIGKDIGFGVANVKRGVDIPVRIQKPSADLLIAAEPQFTLRRRLRLSAAFRFGCGVGAIRRRFGCAPVTACRAEQQEGEAKRKNPSKKGHRALSFQAVMLSQAARQYSPVYCTKRTR